MIEEIEAKLRDLKNYTELLKGYRRSTKEKIHKDMTLRGAIERYMQLAIEIIIEIGEMIISQKGFKKPETYREVIEILGQEGVLTKDFARNLAPAAGFRNILIHRYGEVDIDELYKHLQKDIEDFDTFARQIAKYLKGK